MRYYCFSCVSFVVGRSVIVEKRSNTFAAADLYCRQHNIKEVSRGGKYHNKRFKAIAEAHGLTCVPCGQYGWNTTPGDNLVEYALNKGWNEILLGRNSLPPAMRTGATGTAQPGAAPGGEKRPSSTRKLICPKCGQSVRATRKVNILCGDCLLPMVEVKNERAHSKAESTEFECARSKNIRFFVCQRVN